MKIQSNLDSQLYIRPCPACNHNAYIKKMEVAPDHYLNYMFSSDFRAEIVQCAKCGMVYTNPLLRNKYLNKIYLVHYQNNKFPETDQPDNILREDHFITASKMLYNSKHRTSILDIGCNYGEFVNHLQQCGFDAHGIDIQDKKIEYGKKRWKINNISNASFDDIKIEKFDMVNLSQLIEHLSNPIDFLSSITSRMQKGSLIFISVPNFKSILQIYRTKKIIVPYQHCNNYTYRHLRLLLNTIGIEPYPQNFSFKYQKINNFVKAKEVINLYSTKIFNYAPSNLMIIGIKYF